MDQPVGGKGADEYHDNVVDIVSIHQKIHHYFKRQLDHGGDHGDGDHDGNAMNFDFYLVQAIPLLTTYQSMIKDRGKIRFSSAVAQQPRVIVSGHDGTKESTQFSTADPDGVEDTDALIAPFPYVPDHVSKRGIRSDLQGLVNKYLDLVERYFPDLYHHMEMESLHKCTSSPFKKEHVEKKSDMRAQQVCSHENLMISHDNMLVCEKCGLTPDQTNVSPSISFKDINRVNLASKYLYDRITHFKDCINQFQGKQNCTIDKKVYDDLLEQFISHRLIPENYKDLPREEAFRDITKEHIMLFLKECRHTKHYEDVVLIHSVLTGVPPPDITSLENQLLHDFDQLTNLYDKKYRQNDRKNFINTQYVLYQLLKRHKFPCKKEDFNILKTIDRKFYHDDICKSLFEELDWNFNPTF